MFQLWMDTLQHIHGYISINKDYDLFAFLASCQASHCQWLVWQRMSNSWALLKGLFSAWFCQFIKIILDKMINKTGFFCKHASIGPSG